MNRIILSNGAGGVLFVYLISLSLYLYLCLPSHSVITMSIPVFPLHGIVVVALLVLGHGVRERREPPDGEAAEHSLDTFPARLLVPALLLLLQLLDARLVVPNGRDLCAQHNHREDGKQEALEHEEEQQHNGGWWGVGGTGAPLALDAERKLVDGQEYRVH